MATKSLRIQVPASTSNIGPGFDALGIAVNLALDVRWVAAESTLVERTGAMQESLLAVGQDPIVRGMRRAAILSGKPLPPGKITVSAPFPPGRGLGASGAGLVAGLMLGAKLVRKELTPEVLLQEAIGLEGNPENAVAALLGGAHWSLRLKNRWWHSRTETHKDLRFLFVIPPFPLDTARAREVLPRLVSMGDAVAQAQRAGLLREALKSLEPELLRVAVQDSLVVAPRLKLLTGVGPMIAFAEKAGALAATLSGAGSSVLVLTRRQQVADLELRLKRRATRLWGESGMVLRAAVEERGGRFLT
ncbi:MAG: homoserine kinase [Planctomycetota bacterium]|nr:homoserine kinase [Planctomycetota bacterium]